MLSALGLLCKAKPGLETSAAVFIDWLIPKERSPNRATDGLSLYRASEAKLTFQAHWMG